MRHSLLTLTALPFALLAGQALASDECRHTAPRDLQLDLRGVKAVMFEIGPHNLVVKASPGAKAEVKGKACASDPDRLADLTLTQQRVGEKLVIKAERDDIVQFNFGGNHYAYLVLNATVPDDVMVQVDVGSGDARVEGASAMSADVGSGDVEARNIRGQVTADVNSGDIELDTIGSLHVLSVGSGHLNARRVKGNAVVGDIGSGSVELRDVGGDVSVEEIGSGDLKADQIAGNVNAGRIGSGGLDAHDVRGSLTVRRVGSGSVDHSGITGRVDVPSDD